MKHFDPLKQAVIDAEAELNAAREKLTRAENAYNKAIHKTTDTWTSVDISRRQAFSASVSAPTLTDC